MRKLLLFSLVLLLIFAYATAALALPADYGPIEVLLFNGNGYTKTSVYPAYLSCDGQAVEMDVPGILYDNRTLVPIRFVGELLGAKIDWDQQTSQATFEKDDTKIVLEVGSATAYVNGKPEALPGDVSVELATYQGSARTMVPLRFVSEELGADVDWDQTNKTVLLSLPVEEEPEPEEPAVPTPGEDDTPAATVSQWQDWIKDGKVLVVVDAGHGGSDPGAVYGGVNEKAVNLAVAQKVEALLAADGIDVIMTREGDTYPSLSERPALANEEQATVFVSVHSNSASATSATGIETYYSVKNPEEDMSKTLAQYVQKAIIEETGAKDRGVKSANYVVLREAFMPAVLVELGFMTNDGELANLTDSEYQDLLAQGIYQGIVDFLASLGMK